jgi:hypothetical protein
MRLVLGVLGCVLGMLSVQPTSNLELNQAMGMVVMPYHPQLVEL